MGRGTVHGGAVLDGEGQDVAVVAQVHLGVAGQLVAQQLGGLVHGDQASVGVLAAEAGPGGGVVVAEHDLAGAALDAVAADDGAVGRVAAVNEAEPHAAVVQGVDVLQALAEARDAVGHQLDHLVEEVGAVHGGLARGRGQRVDQLAHVGVGVGVGAAVAHAAAEVEPDVLLVVPLVEGGDLLEACPHLGGDQRHGARCIGAERDASADFAEGVCRLVQRDGDVCAEEPDGEGYAGDAAADDGDAELGVGRHGGGGGAAVVGREEGRAAGDISRKVWRSVGYLWCFGAGSVGRREAAAATPVK